MALAGEKRDHKTGGRKAGIPNNLSLKAKEILCKALDPEIKNISKYFKQINSPKDKLEILAKLLPYVVPKLAPEVLETPDTGNQPPKDITFLYEQTPSAN